MEIAISQNSSRKNQCKLSDYVSTTVAATIAMLEQGNAKEPKCTPNKRSEQVITPKTNPIMTRIQRDLNSPSANLRMRALKAIRSPTKSAYQQFDVSQNEHSIITQEERENATKTPPSLREILKDIAVYVEVRTADDDRSDGVKKVIAALGARITDNLRKDTTHVIFKDGRMSTFKKAKSWNIPIVSILWIEACKNQRLICDPNYFPISNLERYENPELFDKIKRYKFIQPGSEDKKRRPKKPVRETTPEQKNLSQTDLGRFFKVLNSEIKITNNAASPAGSNVVNDSPATALLNRISSGMCTPIVSNAKRAEATNNETTPLNSRRESDDTKLTETTNSVALLSICQTPQENLNNIPQSTRKNSTHRRRTLVPNKTTQTLKFETPKNESSQNNLVVLTEEIIVQNKNSAHSMMVRSTIRRRTSIDCKSMDISDNGTPQNKLSNYRRRTLFTPQEMIESPQLAEKSTVDGTNPSATIIENKTITTTPKIPENEIIEEGVPLSASRHLCRRRTLFDISMDIIHHQVQNINSKSRQSILVSTPSIKNIETPENTKCNATIENCNTTFEENNTSNANPDSNVSTANEKKKRKLFNPIEFSTFTPPVKTPPKNRSQTARKSVSASLATPKAAAKRRRTLMPIDCLDSNAMGAASTPNVLETAEKATSTKSLNKKLTENIRPRRSTLDFETITKLKSSTKIKSSKIDIKENNLNPSNTNVVERKPIAIAKKRLPFLAYTNMHKQQIAVMEEAVNKLGCFALERNVGPSTTHMVSLEPRRTMNLLRGLVRGLWIVEFNWVLESLNAGFWLSEEHYELKDFSRAVEICRAERQAFGNNYKCELFADLGAFFISPRCDNVPIRDLKDLIRLCSGKVVEQRQDAKYILSSSTRAIDDKIYVTPLWILDSITQMQLLRIQKYSAITQLPTKHTPSNTRNMPTAVDHKDLSNSKDTTIPF